MSGEAKPLPLLRVINDATNSLGVVRSLHFHVTALPLLHRALVKVEATLLNELSLDYDAHTLHVPLHPDDVVCALKLQTAEGWTEACVVPAAVPPLPRAKGRPAPTSPFPLWCTAISLPFQQPRGIRFTIAAVLPSRTPSSWLYSVPFSFPDATEVRHAPVDCHPSGAFSAQPAVEAFGDTMIQGWSVAIDATIRVPQSGPRTVVAHQHFCSLVPQAAIDALLPPTTADVGPQHLLLAFDVSLSCWQRWKPQECDAFLAALEAEYFQVGCPMVVYTVARFGQYGAPVVQRGGRGDVVNAVSNFPCEGATDLRALDAILNAVRDVNAILVFSDGLDSLGDSTLSLPRVINGNAPLYSILPPDRGDPLRAPNRHFLEWLATKRGGLCLPMGPQLATEIAQSRKRAYAIGLKVLQAPNTEATTSFDTVPDWRERQFWWPSGDNGLEISGTVPANSAQLTLTLRRGAHVVSLPLVLPPEDHPPLEVMRLVSVTHAVLLLKWATRTLPSLGACTSSIVRICQRYRVAGPFTTLRVLDTLEERLEYDQPYRETDPLYEEWVQAKAKRDHALQERAAKVVARRMREAYSLNARNCKILHSIDSSLHRSLMTPLQPDKPPPTGEGTVRKKSGGGLLSSIFGTGPPEPVVVVAGPPAPPTSMSRMAPAVGGDSGVGDALQPPPKQQWVQPEQSEEAVRELGTALARKLSDVSKVQIAPAVMKEYNAPFGDEDPGSPFMDVGRASFNEDIRSPGPESDHEASPSTPSSDDGKKSSKQNKQVGVVEDADSKLPAGRMASSAFAMDRTFSVFEDGEMPRAPSTLPREESGGSLPGTAPAQISPKSGGPALIGERRDPLLSFLRQQRQSPAGAPKVPKEAASGSEDEEESDSDDEEEGETAGEGRVEQGADVTAARIYLTPLLAQWHAHLRRVQSHAPFQTFGIRHLYAATTAVRDQLAIAARDNVDSFKPASEFFFSTLHQHQDNPGYYYYVAEMFRDAGAPATLSERIIMCVLEVCEPYITAAALDTRRPERPAPDVGSAVAPSDATKAAAQVLRSVGYFLLGINQTDSAMQVLNTLLQVAPGEPQTHIDVALACFLFLRQQNKQQALDQKSAQPRLIYIFKHLATVLRGTWQATAVEVEWPAMLLASWVVAWAEAHGMPNSWGLTGLHPCARVPFLPADLLVWCAWDTANTVVDLNITEPNEKQVCVETPYSAINPAILTNEGRSGFGPTCYVCVKAKPGTYKLACQHHTRDKDSLITGPTRVLVMSARHMGDPARDKLSIRCMRLPSDQDATGIMYVPIAESSAGQRRS